jgi:hypothetical protein
VFQNLYDFLQRERRHPRFSFSNYYWIDALCINQQDDAEKTHEVKQMVHIYKEANNAIFWLGNNSIEFLRKIASPATFGPRQHQRFLRAVMAPSAYDEWIPDPKYISRDALLENSSWTRIWIIQEVMHAKEIPVRCGSTELRIN